MQLYDFEKMAIVVKGLVLTEWYDPSNHGQLVVDRLYDSTTGHYYELHRNAR